MKLLEDTNKDTIIAFLKNPLGDEHRDLTAKQQQLLQYYVDAYTLSRNYNSVQDAIVVLVKLSQKRGEPISASTARRYVYDSQDVFGYVSKVKPEAIQHLALEIIKDAIAMARDQNDPKTMILGADKLMVHGGKETEQPFNPEMVERHEINIDLDPEQKAVINLLTGRGIVDLDRLMGNVMNSLAEDAKLDDDGRE